MKKLSEYINEQLINEHFVNIFNKNDMVYNRIITIIKKLIIKDINNEIHILNSKK